MNSTKVLLKKPLGNGDHDSILDLREKIIFLTSTKKDQLIFDEVLKDDHRYIIMTPSIRITSSAQKVVNILNIKEPDILIADNCISRKSLRLIKIIRQEKTPIKIITIIEKNELPLIMRLISLRVDGLVLQKNKIYEIDFALSKLSNNEIFVSHDILLNLVEHLYPKSHCPLSARQKEILSLMLSGMTYTEIGKRIGLAPDTIKSHIKNIYSNLKVDKKSEAIRLAINNNWIPVIAFNDIIGG